MQTFDRPALPTATAREHRLRLFQPTRRPVSLRDSEIVTPWGRVLLTGRLGQAHADLLDALMFCAERKAELEDGRIKLLVDPARVRRAIGVGGEQLDKLARELASATIQIKEPQEIACIGHLVDHIDTAVRADGTPITRHNPLGGERALWRVEIGKALCRLIARDAWVGYDPTPIARLQHGISQAVARHVLSHKTAPVGGWRIDTLIRAAAGDDISDANLWNRRREIRADAETLRTLGIEIDDDRVRRL